MVHHLRAIRHVPEDVAIFDGLGETISDDEDQQPAQRPNRPVARWTSGLDGCARSVPLRIRTSHKGRIAQEHPCDRAPLYPDGRGRLRSNAADPVSRSASPARPQPDRAGTVTGPLPSIS